MVRSILAFISLAVSFALGQQALAQNSALPETVQFRSLDGTMLTGYVYRPAEPGGSLAPAVVMMHGRAGVYSSLARGRYDVTTITQRHKFWGQHWAAQGYVAILVDGFGPRGYPDGFPFKSYDTRPAELNEVTVRPLDAYGALKYLGSLPGIDPARVALQGWSNGGSAVLAAMSDDLLQSSGLKRNEGFRGGLAFFPGCGLHNRFNKRFAPVEPVHIFHGDADEEVTAARCQQLVNTAQPSGGKASISVFPGATHGFDDPVGERRRNPANVAATNIAVPT